MQIVFLLDLLLDLPVNSQPHNKRIASPGCRRRVGVDKTQSFVQMADRLAGTLDFLVHCIFKITRQALDLLGLLLQIVPEPHKLVDHLVLHLGSLVCFQIALAMEIPENFGRIR